jgi:pimeloyl-ACP methyl ester carboxylesterase
LVLVHGVASDRSAFRLLEPLLAPRFSVVSVDRRGRCGSADHTDYSLEAEFEDLVAVVEALPEPCVVFGHSFGANVALGASLRTALIRGLVLYEPGAPGDVSREFVAELESLVAAEDRVAAMRLVIREFTEFPEEWLDDLLETPPWQKRLAYAHTLPREVRAYLEYDYGDLSRINVPTLFLVGGESPRNELVKARALAAVMPGSRVSVVQGHGHDAPVTAPQLVAAQLVAFADTCSHRIAR